MPPKQNITKKTTTQKQKQKKAKQQQQQQQGQNVKINIRVGETKKPRAPRKPSNKKQPPKQPPKPPPNVPIQQPQYVPMFLSQQPPQYFTPPVPTTTLPMAPPGSAVASITPTTLISPSAGSSVMTRPIPTSRSPSVSSESITSYFYEPHDVDDTFLISGVIRDFGTQTQDIAPSAMSATLKEMQTQTEQFIPTPPPPRQTQALPPPPIPKEFTAPTQDIQPSALQSIVNLTQENLSRLGGISASKEYAPSEISDITRSTMVDLPALIMESAKKRESMRQQTLDEIIEKRKEKKMEEKKSEGIMGQLASEMEKRRNLLQPPEEEDLDEIDYAEWEIEKPVEKPDKKKMMRKPGSGRPKGSGNKSEVEREYENIIKIQKELIRENKQKIKNMRERKLDTDAEDNTINDYEQMNKNAQREINDMNQLIQEEKDRRKLQPIPEFGFEDEEEEY